MNDVIRMSVKQALRAEVAKLQEELGNWPMIKADLSAALKNRDERIVELAEENERLKAELSALRAAQLKELDDVNHSGEDTGSTPPPRRRPR